MILRLRLRLRGGGGAAKAACNLSSPPDRPCQLLFGLPLHRAGSHRYNKARRLNAFGFRVRGTAGFLFRNVLVGMLRCETFRMKCFGWSVLSGMVRAERFAWDDSSEAIQPGRFIWNAPCGTTRMGYPIRGVSFRNVSRETFVPCERPRGFGIRKPEGPKSREAKKRRSRRAEALKKLSRERGDFPCRLGMSI